ncbi:hypothetical protein DFJ63DRAFT_283969 [Scheffersomyces coipomensis]|uniref:uncharacterized protein n=1 Tax=Scheffersomyces coipomensis TaxID=1788519 RepID=UPI00315D5ED5
MEHNSTPPPNVISTQQLINNNISLKGKLIDKHTRCQHYYSKLDIIALKYKCCRVYYPCFQCHLELIDHNVEKFNVTDLAMGEKVVLCGNCYSELTFKEYSEAKVKSSISENEDICYIQTCIKCNSQFNPNCSLHYELYFDLQ